MHPWPVPWHKFKSSGGGADSGSKFNSSRDLRPTGEAPTPQFSLPSENSTIQFRAEFFNAFNHPQFANPDTNFTSPTFASSVARL
jgi:hypothetical protein